MTARWHRLTRQDLVVEAPSLGVALVVAELFYKFHSFTRECLAFLATWYVLSLVGDLVRRAVSRAARRPAIDT